MKIKKEDIEVSSKKDDTIYIGVRIPKHLYDELENIRKLAEKKGFKLTLKEALSKAFILGLDKAEKDMEEELKKEQKNKL